MLTFLRKIRRSLIGSGSTGKYVLYATGEIALVVIGILIALQINNWNSQKTETRIIKGYYLQISDEFTSLASIITEKSKRSQIIYSQIRTCQELIMENDPKSLKKLQECLGYLGTSLTNNLQYPIFQEFVNQGYLSRIKEKEIKAVLSEVSERLLEIEEFDRINNENYNISIEPFFISKINFSKIISPSGKQRPNGGPDLDYQQLQKDIELWNLLILKYDLTKHIEGIQNNLIELLKKAAALLKESNLF